MKTGFFKKAGALGLAFFVAAGGLTGLVTPPEASANHKTSSIVINAASGQVYSRHLADTKRYPASLTKIMTLIVAFDALKKGQIDLETELTVPHAATMMPKVKLGLKEGQALKVGEALNAMVVLSANDVAVTLAYGVAGSERAFVKLMNEKAKEIGLKKTRFENTSGLFHPRQITTAHDMAKLARHLIDEYPGYYEYFSRKNFEFESENHDTHNHLMQQYEGMDGIKTGYIGASGYNLVSSAVRNDRRLIGVIFGGHSAAGRDAAMARLLDDAFRKAANDKDGTVDNRHQKWRQDRPPSTSRSLHKKTLRRLEISPRAP